jgi:predicted kinase
MRKLVVLRGAPASGKSTFVKNHNLEDYTISTDDIRLLYGSPIIGEDGNTSISQKNNKQVFELMFDVLEHRMLNGEFIVVDATHCNKKDFNKYKSLAKLHRYRVYVVDFNRTLEELKENNEKRKFTSKFVPEHVIEKMHFKQQSWEIPSWANVIKEEDFHESIIGSKRFNYNNWEEIHHIGDIHGCYDTLMNFVGEFLNPEHLYIFTGDLFDRGEQNKEVLNFMLNNYYKDNVVFIEGNHDTPMNYYANNRPDLIKNRVFKESTIPQIEEGLSDKEIVEMKRKIRHAMRHFKDYVHYTFGDDDGDNVKVFVSHGGLSNNPMVSMSMIPSVQFIRGVGDYSLDIDKNWSESNSNILQIHGHRNTFEHPIVAGKKSVNLEGGVESGGDLRVYTLYKNEHGLVFQYCEEYDSQVESKNEVKTDEENLVDKMRNNNFIQEKQLGDNISSFNFTRKAFKKGVWNDLTVKARGLFINTHCNEIVARGYDKFFNINEVESTKEENLKRGLKFPVRVYEKPNGYLGLLGYNSEKDELVFASKSQTNSPHAKWFKELFYKKTTEMSRYYIKNYLKEHNSSLTFEVISFNDPHIIEYSEEDIILLDIIKRDIDFSKEPYGKADGDYSLSESVTTLAGIMGWNCKKLLAIFGSYEQYHSWYKREMTQTTKKIEGYVIEDSKGFMFKIKMPYYNFWKQIRTAKDMYAKGNLNIDSLYERTHNRLATKWIINEFENINKEELKSMSIIDFRNYFKEKEGTF